MTIDRAAFTKSLRSLAEGCFAFFGGISLACVRSTAAVHAVWRLRRFAGDELVLPAILLLTGVGLAMMVTVRDPLRDLPLYRGFAEGVAWLAQIGLFVMLGLLA